MNASSLVLPVTLVAGLSLGFGAGFLSRPSAGHDEPGTDGPIGKSSARIISSLGTGALPGTEGSLQQDAATPSLGTVLATGALDAEWQWVERIRQASAAQMPALLEQLEQHPDDESFQFLRRLLMAHWHELDPAGAMAFAKQEGKGPVFHDLYREWARKDMDAALASLEQLEGYQLSAAREEISMAAAQRYSLSEFMNWTERLNEGHIHAKAFRVAFERFAQRDLGSALAALDEVKWKGRFNAVPAVAEVYADADPRAALAWARSLEEKYGSEPSELAMAAVLKRYASLDPDILAREAIDLAGGSFWRGGLFAQAADQLFENESPAAAAEWMKKWLDPGGQRFQAGNLIAKHAEQNFKSALGLVQAMGDDFWEMGGFFGLPQVSEPAELLAQFDARAAELNPRAHAVIRDKLLNQWASLDFDAAVDYALANFDAEDRQPYLRLLFQRAGDPLDAWDRSAELPEKVAGQVRRKALSELIVSDADLANELFNQLPDGPERDQATGIIVDRLSQFGPVPAWEWTQQLEEGTVKAKAYRAIAAVYAEGDPLGASEWIDTMPAGESRDRAIMALTNKTTRDDPEGAFIWASQIDNPNIQMQQLSRALGRWGVTDPAAADHAIRQLNLDDLRRQQLLDRLAASRDPFTSSP